jgi:hypothetical protein
MPFETFKRQRPPVSPEPALTIQKRGTLSLNAAAYEALDSPEGIELLYDRDERLIGLRKIAPTVDHAYVVRPLGRGGTNWLISGRSFTRFYGIPTEPARRWLARTDGDMLVVDLKEPGTEVVGARSRDRAASLG